MPALLFKSILKESSGKAVTAERRSSQRFALNPNFPLKSMLSFIARDDTGELMSNSREGWHWKGRLLDISEYGARLQLGPGLRAKVGDSCDLGLSIGEFNLSVPCHLVHLHEGDEGMVFGLRHEIDDSPTWAAYRQLIEVVALGYTLKPQATPARPDAGGYLVERFASPRPARLTLWRQAENKLLAAFEFVLKGNIVRAMAGSTPEYLTYVDGTAVHPAATTRALEIHRLFQWVVPNLAPVVPDDVRGFLRNYI
ncbi:MAG: PilZ domain-containing protein [Opitutales bacterium]